MISIDDIFKSRGYNVPTYVFDADGKKVKIETREDEEQWLKYERIVNLLIAAGYYRAMIKQISPFDIIVGGMTWCIDSSDIDIDVDLLFKDSLTIGQKISLTEKIVVVLPKIKCPHFIEPHQIQGLDFIHIYPVIKWLIHWSEENRRKKRDYLLSYAMNQYYKRYTDPNNDRLKSLKSKALQNINYVSYKYQPRRIAKQTDKSAVPSIFSKVEGTLSEYGLFSYKKDSGFLVGINLESVLKDNEIATLLQSLKLSNSSEENLNFEQADILYDELQGPERKIQQLNEEIRRLNTKKENLETSLENSIQESHHLSSKLEEKNLQLDDLAVEERKIVEEMQNLIQIHDKLKEEEKIFKDLCKSDMHELEAEIHELEASQAEEETEQLRYQLRKTQAQLESKKEELGRKTKDVSAKQRIIDQVPSRAELSQYQKRFLELYKQVAIKHNETKKYYILYNTVSDTYGYMEKEFKILNSIQENFTEVTASGGNRDEFLQQLKGIVAGIQNIKEKVTESRDENKRSKTKLRDHLQHLQEQKREYINAVKELSEHYKRYEHMSIRLKKLLEDKDGQT